MANPDYPRGFIPHRKTDGTSLLPTYFTISDSNLAIDINDLVELDSDGYVKRADAATAANILGSAGQGVAANTGGKIPVFLAENTVFLAQVDDASIADQSGVGLNYEITLGSASGSNSRSNMEIDGDTGAATAALPVKVIGLWDFRGNDFTNAFGANVVVECIINQSVTKGAGVAGV